MAAASAADTPTAAVRLDAATAPPAAKQPLQRTSPSQSNSKQSAQAARAQSPGHTHISGSADVSQGTQGDAGTEADTVEGPTRGKRYRAAAETAMVAMAQWKDSGLPDEFLDDALPGDDPASRQVDKRRKTSNQVREFVVSDRANRCQ